MQTRINYGTPPNNYAVIDRFLSRSAQPCSDNLRWLKLQHVTDIINFRIAEEIETGFNEKSAVKVLGMNYHHIPSTTYRPEERNVVNFLNLIEQIKARKGKAHIHCKAGADRTGMYAFLYKGINKIGNTAENEKEWLAMHHNSNLYPQLIPWAKKVLKHLKKQ